MAHLRTLHDTPQKRRGLVFYERFYPEQNDNEVTAKAIIRQDGRRQARRTILGRLLLLTKPCTSLPTHALSSFINSIAPRTNRNP
jgi:hypothetical protein